MMQHLLGERGTSEDSVLGSFLPPSPSWGSGQLQGGQSRCRGPRSTPGSGLSGNGPMVGACQAAARQGRWGSGGGPAAAWPGPP